MCVQFNLVRKTYEQCNKSISESDTSLDFSMLAKDVKVSL